MALIILYFFSLILILIGIEPLKTAGIFLNICYLPGFLVFTLSKKDKLVFEDLILAFPCSIGISSILVLMLLFLGVHVKYIPYIINAVIGFIVALYIVIRNKNKAYTAVKLSKQELIFCLFAFLITLLLSIPFFLGPNRHAIASHAFFHSSIISQILNGVFPPENPGLGGTPIWFYWAFHSLIATLTAQTNFQQIQIMFLLNVLSLYMIFCISYSFARAFDLPEGCRYIFPLAAIGLMRSDAGIFFIKNLLSWNLISLNKSDLSLMEPIDVLSDWVRGVSWYDERLFFMNKFYNVSGMPLAISLCLAYLLLLLLFLRKNYAENKIYLINLSIVIIACSFNYPPLAIIPLVHAPLWICYLFLSNKGCFKEKISGAYKVLLPYIVAILIALPYLLLIVGSGSGKQDGFISLDFYAQSIRNLIVFFISFPLIVAGAWIAMRHLAFSHETFFLLIGTSVCFGLSTFTQLPFDNSYKFNFILTFFFALFFVFALFKWLPLLTTQWVKRFIGAGIVVYLLFTPLLVEASYILSSLCTTRKYTFSDRHLIYAQDKQRNEAYTWIRENTPFDSLVMLSYVETNWPCCGLNANYEPSAIAERNLYVIKDKDFTTKHPEYKKRVWFRERLFENPEDLQVVNFFVSLNRPVYLLIDKNLPEDRFFVEERFKKFPENPGEESLLVFRNESQRVYLINVK